MTLPTSPTNNMGGYYTTNVPVDPPGAPAAAANVAQTVPSPSTWENANSELAVQNFTSQLVAAQDDGTAFTNCPSVTPGTAPNGPSVGLKEDVQTTPAAPSGSYTQEGQTYISRAVSLTKGCISNVVNLG